MTMLTCDMEQMQLQWPQLMLLAHQADNKVMDRRLYGE